VSAEIDGLEKVRSWVVRFDRLGMFRMSPYLSFDSYERLT
jgi:hypothetical protein